MKETSEEKELIPFTKSTLPILEFNFDDMKKELTTKMTKYEGIVVTLETLKEDKKLAQGLKAQGAEFNKQRLEKVKSISAPIVAFTNQMNELKDICITSSELISKQVKVFEDETLVIIDKLLFKTLNEYRDTANIDDEFRICQNIENLVKLGAITAKGALNKGSKDELDAIVTHELALQSKVKFRLLQLESESHKANLNTPLVRLNVESFLFETDEIYQEKLLEVVESEVQRQKLAEETIVIKVGSPVVVVDTEVDEVIDVVTTDNVAERLAARFDSPAGELTASNPHGDMLSQDTSYAHSAENQEVTEREYDEYANTMMTEQASHQPEPSIQLKEGHVMCIAVATFKVSVPHQITEEMVQQKLVDMMSNTGIESLDNIKVTKHA